MRLALLLALPLLAAAADGPIDWTSCPDAKGYAAATAWSPAFTDRTLWPYLTGKEAFVVNAPKGGRVLRWAHPGESAGAKIRNSKRDPLDLANWIDVATGKPATAPIDKDTDLWLPASDKPYTVGMQKAGQEHSPITIRSLTVEPGAKWSSAGLIFHGNVWVKRGGGIGNHGATVPSGGTHTFYRHDNGDPRQGFAVSKENGTYPAIGVSQYIKMDKPDGSCEFVGAFALTDEFQVNAGTLIVAPDSRLMPGRNATPRIAKGATLAVMDGGWFGKWTNQMGNLDMELYGTMQGGLPDRPLKRSATWAVGFQNWNGTTIPTGGNAENDKEWNTRRVGVMTYEGAAIRSFTADPAAKLVVAWNGFGQVWPIDLPGSRKNAAEDPAVAAALAQIPRLVTIWIEGGVALEGVEFDHLRAGGLMVPDLAGRSAWRNVTFGRNCAGTGDALVSQAAKPGKGGVY